MGSRDGEGGASGRGRKDDKVGRDERVVGVSRVWLNDVFFG